MTPPPVVTPPSLPIIQGPCAWHTPQAEIDALNLKYPGQVSHSLCADCLDRLLKESA